MLCRERRAERSASSASRHAIATTVPTAKWLTGKAVLLSVCPIPGTRRRDWNIRNVAAPGLARDRGLPAALASREQVACQLCKSLSIKHLAHGPSRKCPISDMRESEVVDWQRVRGAGY
jgi:hypothetical protein